MPCVWCTRAHAFVNHIRGTTKQSEIFRRIQIQLLRQQGAVDEDGNVAILDEEGPEEVEEEVVVPGEEQDAPHRLRHVLALIPPVDSRWNSLYYMLQR